MNVFMMLFYVFLPLAKMPKDELLFKLVKYHLAGYHFDGEEKLHGMGKIAFPAYHRILLSRESSVTELRSTMCILQPEKFELKEFLPDLYALMKHTDTATRNHAMALVGMIGGPNDMQFVMPLLSDESQGVRYDAALIIARKGGRKEYGAMQSWLSISGHKYHASHVQHVKKCLAEMNERLDKEERVPKK